MHKIIKSFLPLLLLLSLLLTGLPGCSMQDAADTLQLIGDVAEIIGEVSEESPYSNPSQTASEIRPVLDEDGSYTTKEDVALYIHTYGRLPSNFVTKEQAQAAGWAGGSLEKYLPGKCIGGSRFGNYEGALPQIKGRTWTECDINTLGASSRGAERIVFSNDGLIYYTGDHYETFELLYGTP